MWFVPCYLLLMLFSPILNAYIEHATSKQLAISLGLIYLFTYYLGIVWDDFHGYFGYAAGWFVILYLTGTTIRKTKHWHGKVNRYKWLLAYLLLSILIVAVALLQYRIPFGRSMLWSYECPLVYLSSICFFMFFVHWDMKFCRMVNWLAASSFAVLLFHIQPFSHYGDVCQYINEHTSGVGRMRIHALRIGLLPYGHILGPVKNTFFQAFVSRQLVVSLSDKVTSYSRRNRTY